MKILVACEMSGRVRDAFRAKGHDAWSCDIEDTIANPRWHIKDDVLNHLDEGWDMMIGHPVCRYLANSGAKHLYLGMKKENGPCPERWKNMRKAAEFFLKLWNAPIAKVAIENPIMHCHAKRLIGMKQTQLIQPWHFGHRKMKATCLWIRGLSQLSPTDIVGPPPKAPEERKAWAEVHRMAPSADREMKRSLTYQGIANAMSEQWG